MISLRRHPQFFRYPEPTRRLLIDIDQSDRYEQRMIAVPDDSNVAVGARSTWETHIPVPPGSWLWGISAHSEESEGFKVQLTDLETGANLASQPILHSNASGQGSASGASSKHHILSRPRFIDSPGLVAAQIINLAEVSNTIQLVLWLSVPADVDAHPETEQNGEAAAESARALGRLVNATRRTGKTTVSSSTVIRPGAAGAGGREIPPWEMMPPGGRKFHYENAVNTPAAGTSNYEVTSFEVPIGWNAAIKQIMARYTGTGFQEGSEDLIWRISIDGAYPPGWDKITTTQGQIGIPRDLGAGAIIAKAGQTVKFTVSVDALATIPTGTAAAIICGFDGYFYPD